MNKRHQIKKKIVIGLLSLTCGGSMLFGCADRQKTLVQQEDETISEQESETVRQTSFTNPITSIHEDAWYDYGTGDPYVMRYNGYYYLYMSTRDTEVGIKCFRSKDLVNWSYEGLCAEEEITKGAYAPEVVYYNGKFYMYSSPAGKGHYVFESDSPTGPFVSITHNIGLSIDGSVFIDDDGKWYFYHADDNGIQAHEMTAPGKMQARYIDVNAKMNGWTEGPMVIKTDGRYYLTYTGNHVFSRGYRINYGVGESPISFVPSVDNPALIHTMGDLYGIGHSSSVKGPDLDSYYIVYHTLIGRAVEGMPKREMNIDRIVFNEGKMDILGPTVSEQQMPDLPAIYAYFQDNATPAGWKIEKDQILSEESLEADFTAEYNLCKTGEGGIIGGYFCYIDDQNYGRFSVNEKNQNVTVAIVKEGQETDTELALQGSFGEPVLLTADQAFQVEKQGNQASIYMNDRLIGTFDCDLAGGAIGYFAKDCETQFGFIGGSNAVGGSSARTYAKPLPGTVQGVHNATGSENLSQAEGYGDTKSLLLEDGKGMAEYVVNIEQDGEYDFSVFYTALEDGSCQLLLDGQLLEDQVLSLPAASETGEYQTALLRKVPLPAGNHTLTLSLSGNGLAISEFSCVRHEEVEEIALSYDSILDDYSYSDGEWRIKGGQLSLTGEGNFAGKRLYGSESWGDYTVTARIAVDREDSDAGILVRASNPALGSAGDSPTMGTYFVQGYYAALRDGKVVLQKLNYNYTTLAEADLELKPAQESYEIIVTAYGNEIVVTVDGRELIRYKDQIHPFLQGMAGVRTLYTSLTAEDFSIQP